jgi:hypothetical protein
MSDVEVAAGAETGTGAGGATDAKSVRKSAAGRANGGYQKKKKQYNEDKKTKCSYCGRTSGQVQAAGGTMAPDHVASWAGIHRLGSSMGLSREQLIALHNDERNLMPACHGTGGCNNSRGDRNPMVFARERGMSQESSRALNAAAEAFRGLVRSGGAP